MNTRTLIEELDKLHPQNVTEVTRFLESCQAYTRLMNIWIIQTQDKYGINLTKIEISDEDVTLTKDQKIMSAIAADLYYQHAFLNRNINIDKLNMLAEAYPHHEDLQLLRNAVHYFGMSLQSYLQDAEGGIMSINAHTMFAQNRTGSVQGQLVNQVIIPGIREITAQYTGSSTGEEPKYKRGLFFSKAHSSLAKHIEEDMLRIMFVENYQPYIFENALEEAITNKIYVEENAELMRNYDALLLKQTQQVNKEYSQLAEDYKRRTGREKVDFITQDKMYGDLERKIRQQETPEEKQLKRQVENLPISDKNEIKRGLVNGREYSDNTNKSFNDLCHCLQFLDTELKRENSVELNGLLKRTILTHLEEHGLTFEKRPSRQLQKT